jgi:2-polyprenyl-6-hydroxyphenyl methylase/3-demethylubiquinone-9 3-methyltransferase
MVADGGQLFVSIYNDQGWQSNAWRGVKHLYNVLPGGLRLLVVLPCFVGIQGAITLRDTLRGDPLRTWRLYRKRRGMSPWYDMVDWVGGYPFEVARPAQIREFYEKRGFRLENSHTVGSRMGCNEFVFRKVS